jgi:hypothetical protein
MAGGTNVGSLNATLSLSEFEFVHGLEQSAAAAREFANQTEVAANRANASMAKVGGGIGGKGQQAITNLGYAAQDFTSQLDRGLGPALAATTNNTMMLTSAMPGLWGALATGAVIALPFIVTHLEKQGLLWKSNKKELEEYTEAWKKSSKEISKQREMDRDALKSPVKEFDDKQQGRKDKMGDINAEIDALNKQIVSTEKGITDPNSIWLKKSKILRDQAAEKIKEWKILEAELKSQQGLRPKVIDNESQRAVEEKKKAAEKAEAERLNKGVQESQKLKLQALEQFGTASQKLTAKQERERSELSDKMKGLVESESALALQKYGHEVEAARLKIEETEKGISKLGNMPGMSAGLRTDSSEGLSQMNKWAQGDAGKSVLQEQLEVQKKQLTLMEQQARGEVLSPHEKAIMSGVNDQEPTLGIATDRWDKSGHQDLWADHWKKDAEKNRQMGFGEWDKGQTARDNRPGNAEVQSVLTAKRAREVESSQQVRERIELLKAQKEANKLLADIARKPVGRVVALN